MVFLKVNFLIFRNHDIQHINLKSFTKYRNNKLKVIALFPKTVKYQVYLNSHSILSDPKLILRTKFTLPTNSSLPLLWPRLQVIFVVFPKY